MSDIRIPQNPGISSNGQFTVAEVTYLAGFADLTHTQGDVFYINSGGQVARLTVGGSGTVLTSNGPGTNPTWTSPSGTGTVTATGGSLTANAVVLGAGTVDTKVVAGITTDGASVINLGVNTTTIGKIKFFGNTSGDATVQPAAVAGTATVLTLPAVTGTLATLAGTEIFTNKTISGAAISGALTGTGAYIPVTLLNSGTLASATTFWRGDGTWATPAGSGTVTATGGNLTANSLVLGAGTTDTKVVAGIISDGVSAITLGVNAATIGKIKFFGNTSGDATIQPTAAAGTATVQTLPATTGTLVNRVTTANGVSASNTDGALTFTLGAITPTTVNGNTFTTGTYTLTGTAAKTLNFTNSLTLTGTDSTTMTFPTTSATIARTDAANTFTGVQTMTSPALTTPAITGVSTGSGVATAATVSTLALRDANGNLTAVNHIEGWSTTATAAGTTTLTVTSNYLQFFTGVTTQTATLPTTSIVAGQQYQIVNNSTGAVTVQSSGANTILILAAGTSALFTSLVVTPTTAANWAFSYAGVNAATGKVATISNTITFAGTDATTMTFPSTSATIARTDAANTFTGVQTMTSPALTTPAITGLATGTGVASAATASTLVARDANANESSNAFIPGYTTTVTAAGTTTLTIASTQKQVFTGSTTQTVKLPTTSVVAGAVYEVINSSSGVVTVQSSGANTVIALPAATSATFTALVATPTTSANWFPYLYNVYAVTGKTVLFNNTITFSGTDATTITFPSTTATVARTDAAQTFTGTQTFSQVVTTNNAIAASANAATVPITSRLNTVTNNSAATLTITMTTTSAVDGQLSMVRILDFSAVAQTITWVNTENSTVTAPVTSNGSTTLFLTVGFIYNAGTSKWRCIASA